MPLVDSAAPGRGPALSWPLAVVVAGLMLAGALGAVVAVTSGPLPPFLDPDQAPAGEVMSHTHAPDLIHVAGSGSNLPLTRALARAFEARGKGKVVVHASIGSRGGVRAAQDGAVEVGLVSRELTEAERTLGMRAHPYARTPVTAAVHPSVPDLDIPREQLVSLYDGRQATWSDGSRVVVLQRESGDSSHRAVEQVLPEFGEANRRAYEEGRWRVIHHDAGMVEALTTTAGAIGLFSQGGVPPGAEFRALKIDGVMPGPETVESGAYPFHKDLAMVTRGDPKGLAAELIAFVHSPEGRALITDLGYLPLTGEE